MSSVKRVCFVCLGNIARSPLAQNMFVHLAKERGTAGRYQVESAGTGAWHVGEEPDPRMRRVAAKRGLVYNGQARQFSQADFERFDHIIVMDDDNRWSVLGLARGPEDEAKVRMLREFDPHGGPRLGVPDPYYGGINGFEEVYTIVERATRGLLDELEGEADSQEQA